MASTKTTVAEGPDQHPQAAPAPAASTEPPPRRPGGPWVTAGVVGGAIALAVALFGGGMLAGTALSNAPHPGTGQNGPQNGFRGGFPGGDGFPGAPGGTHGDRPPSLGQDDRVPDGN